MSNEAASAAAPSPALRGYPDANAIAVDLVRYIKDNEHLLEPPVCNKMVHNDGTLRIMIVGGPNIRKDYHLNLGEEIFYQIKGDMCLKIVEGGVPKDVVIKEGEIFVLPGKIPHSPQRFPDTIGMVVERIRLPGELDGLRYYTGDAVEGVLWQRFFHVTDLGTQLKPLIAEFFASEAHATGKPTPESAQEAAWAPDTTTMVTDPFPLHPRLDEVLLKDTAAAVLFKKEFVVLVANSTTQTPALPIETECWLWALPPPGSEVSTPPPVVARVNGGLELHANSTLLLSDGITAMDFTGDSDCPVLIVYTLAC